MADKMQPWKRIWLQMDEPEISWCQDKIHDSDIEYVSISAIRAEIEAVRDREPVRHDHANDQQIWNTALDALLARMGLP